MFDLLLFAIVFALAFLVVYQESLTMLAFGLLGAMLGESSHNILTHRYVWWTPELSIVLVVTLFILGCWGMRATQKSTPLAGALLASAGSAGLLAVILLPLLVSIFGHLPLSPYANMLFLGTIQELSWTLGAFGTLVVASRVGR